MTRLVALADTHVRAGGIDRLPPPARHELARADLILHAGDVVERPLLDDLARLAPVHAVLGNNDTDLGATLPETVELELDGVRVAMIHDSGPRKGREGRLCRRFPTAALVVFGHSHIPWDAAGVEGQWLLNPGSATQRRSQPHRTLGIVELGDGRIRRTTIVTLD